MVITCKVALKPTKEQEQLFWKFAGASRFVYNYSLDFKKSYYEENGVSLSWNDINKFITSIKSYPEYAWLKEIPFETIKQSVKDMDNAFKQFFKGKGYPKFKKKNKTTPSFYVRYDSVHSYNTDNWYKLVKIPGIAKPVRTCENIVTPDKPLNPRIKFDGKYWYLTFGIEIVKENRDNPTIRRVMEWHSKYIRGKEFTPGIGVDLGVVNTATISNGKVYSNINNTDEVKRLENKLKRLQRKVSRKCEMNKQGGKFVKTRNIERSERELRLVHRKLSNIRNTYNHLIVAELVKTKPERIVLEDLDVRHMLKNKYLAKSISKQGFYEIRRIAGYKGKMHGVLVITANRYFKSSRICSQCGNEKKHLSLNQRTYKCSLCGLTLDRDLNAARNLSNYKAV